MIGNYDVVFFFSSRRRHTRSYGDWSSDVCSSDLALANSCRPPWLTAAGRPGNGPLPGSRSAQGWPHGPLARHSPTVRKLTLDRFVWKVYELTDHSAGALAVRGQRPRDRS